MPYDVRTNHPKQQRLEQNAQSTIQHELLISNVRYLLEQLTQLGMATVYKHTLAQRYQTILAVYERQLTRLHRLRKRLTRLGQVADR